MAGFSDTTENAILALIFTATAWANYADNAASTPQTNVHYALHTADPGDSGTMSTNEATFGSYARQNVARSGSGHTVTNNSVSPNANINFGTASSGTNTITHASSGKTGGGAAAILIAGTVSPNLSISTGVPAILASTSTWTLD